MAEAVMGFTLFKSHNLGSSLQRRRFQMNHSSRLVKCSFNIHFHHMLWTKKWRCFSLLQHSNSTLSNRPWQVRILHV